MTVSQSLVLVLIIALWATGTGVDLANNTTFLIILLIALIALSYATTTSQNNQARRCCFNYQFANNNTNLLTALNNLFA